MGRLPPPGNYNRGTISQRTLARHSGCQMHQESHRTNHTSTMIDQANQLAKIRFPSKVDYVFQRRVMVPSFPYLNETHPLLKVIYHLLHPKRTPPLRREIIFSPAHHDPEGLICSYDLMHLANP